MAVVGEYRNRLVAVYDHQVQLSVASKVGDAERSGARSGSVVAPPEVAAAPVREYRDARRVVVRQREIRPAVAVQIADRDIIRTRSRSVVAPPEVAAAPVRE